MGEGTHVAGAFDDEQPAIGQQLRYAFSNDARRFQCVLSAHDERRALEGSIGARRCRIFDQGMKIERPLGRPADQSALRRWTHPLPCTDATPIIDEPGKSSAIITSENSICDLPRNTSDLREGLC